MKKDGTKLSDALLEVGYIKLSKVLDRRDAQYYKLPNYLSEQTKRKCFEDLNAKYYAQHPELNDGVELVNEVHKRKKQVCFSEAR